MSRDKTPILDNLKVAAPCPADWENMVGTERERFCRLCALNVINISSMPRQEAEEFLAMRASGRVCVKYYRRKDGTIITDNCPRGLRRIRDHWKRVIKAAGALFALISTNQAMAQEVKGKVQVLQGEPTVPQATMGRVAPSAVKALTEENYKNKLKCQLEATKKDFSGIARARADLAYFYRDHADTKKAVEQFSLAADVLRKNKNSDKDLLANILMNWSATEKQNGNGDKAAKLEAEANALHGK